MQIPHDHLIDVNQASLWLKSGEAVVIDVRQPEEYQESHIPHALSFPLDNIQLLFEQLSIDDDKKIIFQCKSGVRSAQACAWFLQNPSLANRCFNLEGGILAWQEANLPTITHHAKQRPSIFRQVQMTVGSLICLNSLFGFFGFQIGYLIAGLLGAALAISGFTGWCGLGLLLQKMPWNKNLS